MGAGDRRTGNRGRRSGGGAAVAPPSSVRSCLLAPTVDHRGREDVRQRPAPQRSDGLQGTGSPWTGALLVAEAEDPRWVLRRSVSSGQGSCTCHPEGPKLKPLAGAPRMTGNHLDGGLDYAGGGVIVAHTAGGYRRSLHRRLHLDPGDASQKRYPQLVGASSRAVRAGTGSQDTHNRRLNPPAWSGASMTRSGTRQTDSVWVPQVGRYGRLATQQPSPGHLLDHSPDTIS